MLVPVRGYPHPVWLAGDRPGAEGTAFATPRIPPIDHADNAGFLLVDTRSCRPVNRGRSVAVYNATTCYHVSVLHLLATSATHSLSHLLPLVLSDCCLEMLGQMTVRRVGIVAQHVLNRNVKALQVLFDDELLGEAAAQSISRATRSSETPLGAISLTRLSRGGSVSALDTPLSSPHSSATLVFLGDRHHLGDVWGERTRAIAQRRARWYTVTQLGRPEA